MPCRSAVVTSEFTDTRGGSELFFLLILLAVVAMVAAQLIIKAQFNAMGAPGLTVIDTFLVAARTPMLWFAVGLQGFAALLWYLCVSRLPLSVAFFFAALAYPMILLGSYAFLGEPVGLRQILGCCLIAVGVLMVALPQST